MARSINNAGDGNCGYLAMSIGLVEIIQQQHKTRGASALFDSLKQSNGDLDLHSILAVDLSKSAATAPVIESLHKTLRQISHQQSLDILQKEVAPRAYGTPEASLKLAKVPLYNDFKALVETLLKDKPISSEHKHFNHLANDPRVCNMAEQVAAEIKREIPAIKRDFPGERQFEAITMMEDRIARKVFLSDVVSPDHSIEPNSIILKANSRVLKRGVWATHDDLKLIAEALSVNLKVTGQLDGTMKKEQPTVTLNNHGNAHWTTQVSTPKVPSHQPLRVSASTSRTSRFFKPKGDDGTSHQAKTAYTKPKETSEVKFKSFVSSLFEHQKEIMAKARKLADKPNLTNEEVAYKLQAEEFEHCSLK